MLASTVMGSRFSGCIRVIRVIDKGDKRDKGDKGALTPKSFAIIVNLGILTIFPFPNKLV